ncbi:hypothetical protein FKW77_001154 [Venturia effusa]|uniref:Flavin reductase like domain-containing protein n=1 Tax=Venturia effusa TaxID=50376 RepID=A0A517LQN9_9PEZI|nr:hypothetical protein FKW77_001154 [Venturia effusa]
MKKVLGHTESLAGITWRTLHVRRHVRFLTHKTNDGGYWDNVKRDSTWYTPRSDDGISEAFRKTMWNLPQSVAVVTAFADSPSFQPCLSIDPTTDNVELLSPYYQHFCGVTISSLQSVTLGPPAIVSFNLKMPSRTLSGLLHHRQFGVHLLLGDKHGKEIADAFVQQRHHEAFKSLSRNGRWVGLGLDPIERVEDCRKRVPLIRGAGIFNFMRCEVLPDKSVQVGDHMVVIAKVHAIGIDPNEDVPRRETLLYVHGNYSRPGTSGLLEPGPERKKISDVKANSLRTHNDILGLSTLSMESTLAHFCRKVQRELPASLQDEVNKYLERNMSWAKRALKMQRAKENLAKGRPLFMGYGHAKNDLKTRLKDLHAKFTSRIPSKFWGHLPHDWPRWSPPWAAGVNPPLTSRESEANFSSGDVKTARDDFPHDRKQIDQQTLPMRENKSKFRPDSSNFIGREEEDGDMSSLSEERYRMLANNSAAQTSPQAQGKQSMAKEEPPTESTEQSLDIAGSVQRSELTDTCIPLEEEELLKISSS